jgi:hypothetical protein
MAVAPGITDFDLAMTYIALSSVVSGGMNEEATGAVMQEEASSRLGAFGNRRRKLVHSLL